MSHNYVDQWQRDLGHVISHKFSAHNWCADCIVAKISINCYISLNPRAMDHFDGQQIGASWGGALPLGQWPVRLCQACCRLVVAKSFFFIFSEFFSGLCLCSSSGSYSYSSSCSVLVPLLVLLPGSRLLMMRSPVLFLVALVLVLAADQKFCPKERHGESPLSPLGTSAKPSS